MIRCVTLILVFCCAAIPAQGERALSAGVTRDSTIYYWVTSIFDEARLTTRMGIGAYRWSHNIPLIDGASYEGGRLDGMLQPATIYLAGMEAGVDVSSMRLFAWVRFNAGNKNVRLLPSGTTGVRFKNGDLATGELSTPDLLEYGWRAEYAPVVWRQLSLGLGFSHRYRGESFTPICDRTCDAGVNLTTTTELYFLYLPVRYQFEWGEIYMRASKSIVGSHESLYILSIATDDPSPPPYEPPPDRNNLTKSEWEFLSVAPSAWKALVGVAVPIYAFNIRLAFHIRRLQLKGAYNEAVGGIKLQVGLPF